MTVHSFEEHGPCVLAHGSMRTFRAGGFADVQPSWVYFFRDGVLVRGAGYATREAALEAIGRYRDGELTHRTRTVRRAGARWRLPAASRARTWSV